MRIKHIDALRGIAAVMVTIFHLTGSAGLSKVTAGYGRYGGLGVEIFFVISGFILPYSLYKTGYKISFFGTFMLKRLIRIYPAYIAAILIGLAMAILTGRQIFSGADLLKHLFLLNNIISYQSISPVFWTLAIEFEFYILIGLLFRFFEVSYTKSLVLLLLLSLSCYFLFRYISFLSWFPFFILGILLFNKIVSKLPYWLFAVATLMVLALIMITHGWPEVLASVFAVCFIIFVKTEKGNRLNKVTLWFGTISYSLYLVHWEMGRAAVSVLRRIPAIANFELVKVFIGFAFSVFCAWLLYLCIEKPSIKYSVVIKYKKDN